MSSRASRRAPSVAVRRRAHKIKKEESHQAARPSSAVTFGDNTPQHADAAPVSVPPRASSHRPSEKPSRHYAPTSIQAQKTTQPSTNINVLPKRAMPPPVRQITTPHQSHLPPRSDTVLRINASTKDAEGGLSRESIQPNDTSHPVERVCMQDRTTLEPITTHGTQPPAGVVGTDTLSLKPSANVVILCKSIIIAGEEEGLPPIKLTISRPLENGVPCLTFATAATAASTTPATRKEGDSSVASSIERDGDWTVFDARPIPSSDLLASWTSSASPPPTSAPFE